MNILNFLCCKLIMASFLGVCEIKDKELIHLVMKITLQASMSCYPEFVQKLCTDFDSVKHTSVTALKWLSGACRGFS